VLDQSITSAFADHRGKGFVTVDHVFDALRKQSRSAESVYGQVDINFLINVGKVCRSRSTYKFQFPYKSPALLKYVSKSEEFNVLRILDAGAGRKKTTYSFDYAYCVAHDIPTHYVTGTERIDRGRSLSTGEWIQRTAQISEELIIHESLLKKIEGKIHFSSKQSGYITGEDGKEYWFRFDDIMESGDNMPIPGRRVKFYPAELDGSDRGVAVELL